MSSEEHEAQVNGPATSMRLEQFRAKTPWSAHAASFATMAVLAGAVAAAMAVVLALGMIFSFAGVPRTDGLRLDAGMLAMALMQITVVAATLWISGWYGGNPRELLSLKLPAMSAWVVGLVAMAAVLLPLNFIVWVTSPDSLVENLRPFARLARSESAWLALAVVGVGAPVSEELLFRGFLLPALTKSRLGFVGAALLSTAIWTLLHFSYSLNGLVEVFLVGLVFCWLMWRYASLWLVMVLHALYNGAQMIWLMLVPL